MKYALASLMTAAFLAGPTLAQQAPGACLSEERDFDTLLTSLEGEGWTAVAPGEALPEAAAESIALARLVFYATTDRGGYSLPDIMDVQRKAVGGYMRRVDTDIAKIRVLTRGDEAMTFNWSQPQRGTLGIVEVICRIASTGGTPVTGTEEGFGPSEVTTLAEAPLRRVMTVALEPALLTELTTDSATNAVVETVTVLPNAS